MITENLNTSLPNGGGPRTEAGKEISSRNALKHGSCSYATLILENESQADFNALEARWFLGYSINPNNPATAYEAELIRTAARADWFFQRADRNYAEAEAQMLNAVPNLLMWGEDHHRTLTRFLRYRTTHTNTLTKLRKAVEDFRKNRDQEAARAQASEHKDEQLVMSKEKLAVYKEKNKPEPTLEEEIEGMRQKAIREGYLTPDGKLPNR
jgi:hypothetical protein